MDFILFLCDYIWHCSLKCHSANATLHCGQRLMQFPFRSIRSAVGLKSHQGRYCIILPGVMRGADVKALNSPTCLKDSIMVAFWSITVPHCPQQNWPQERKPLGMRLDVLLCCGAGGGCGRDEQGGGPRAVSDTASPGLAISGMASTDWLVPRPTNLVGLIAGGPLLRSIS